MLTWVWQVGEFLLLLEECHLTASKSDLTLSHAVELFTLTNQDEIEAFFDGSLRDSDLMSQPWPCGSGLRPLPATQAWVQISCPRPLGHPPSPMHVAHAPLTVLAGQV